MKTKKWIWILVLVLGLLMIIGGLLGFQIHPILILLTLLLGLLGTMQRSA